MDKKLIALMAFFGLLFIILNQLNPTLLWDENAYLGNARSHLTTSNYTEDFRFPILEWLITGAWFFTGESVLAAKLLIIILSLLTILIFYAISEELFPKKAFLATMIYSFSSLFLYWGFRVYTEIPLILFILLSFYCIMKDKYKLAGLFSGLAFLTKFTVAILPFSVILFLLYNKKFKKTILFLSFFLIPLIPWIIFNHLNYGNIIWDFLAQYEIVDAYGVKQPFSIALQSIARVLGVLIFLIPFGVYSALKDKKKTLQMMIFYSAIMLGYFIFFIKIKYDRYLFPIFPCLVLIAYEGSMYIGKSKKLKVFAVLLLIVSVLLGTIPAIERISSEIYCNQNGVISQTFDYLNGKVNSSDLIVSNYWPYFGYHFNSKVSSIWSNPEDIVRVQGPKYFIISPQLGDYFNESLLDSNRFIFEKEFIDKCNRNSSVYKVIY